MCLGVPGKIVKINGKTAKIDVLGVDTDISIQLLEGLQIGDYVIAHAGCAISKIDEEEALKTVDIFKELEEVMYGDNR